MKDHLRWENMMDMDSFYGKMAIIIRDSIRMAKNMDMEN